MARTIGPSGKIQSNLKEIDAIIKDLDGEQRHDEAYQLRKARVYLWETANLLENNHKKIGERVKTTCLNKLTKFQQKLRFHTILQSRKRFSLNDREL